MTELQLKLKREKGGRREAGRGEEVEGAKRKEKEKRRMKIHC